ncbi:hypothetical protein GIB67_013459 [Kingdonia uniflora]|uniref:Sucrase n=1 Tax=Kingdonia uniflora TaxID=39325 RepID=A0A7J7LRD5_9MAGN|nr:hypothetical protein GIB67_013459 [Kingdonia uniflora]
MSRDDSLSFMTHSSSSSSPITVSSNINDNNYIDSQIGSGSGSFQNDGVLSNNDGGGGSGNTSETEFGFQRNEFRQNPLVGTVQIYDRHVFLCYKNPQVWPPHVEAAEFDRLPRLLSAALLARKTQMKKQTRLTICEGHDGTETSNGDVLIFPDMIRYRRLTHFDVDTFVEEVLVKDSEWLPGTPETLRGSYIFVCSHGSRDRRCGVCGPPLVTKFQEEIDARGLQSQVSVSPCSHIGGHKYAGNVIIFSRTTHCGVAGHWYGYVTPDDAHILLDQHIGKGEIIDRLWRGQMGLSEEDQKKAQKLRLQQSVKSNQLNDQMVRTENGAQTEEITGCCQGHQSFSCCKNQVSPEEAENNDVLIKKRSEELIFIPRGKKSEKQITRTTSGKGYFSRTTYLAEKLSIESWEQEDTFATLAVVGAAVSVAIAYVSYKQLR